VNFELYLSSKKIDSEAFRAGEPVLWNSWRIDFEQMHPNSFTVQKLNLINPIRRRFPLKEVIPVEVKEIQAEVVAPVQGDQTAASVTPPASKPAVPRPVFKPKPKTQ